jgi:MFS family permease
MTTRADQRSGTRTFFIVWFGQLVSLVGTSLTGFGLSIYIFQQTGSVTQLASIMLASLLPRLILGPFAGALVDRWDRRYAMILSDLGSGIGTLGLVALYYTDNLTVWTIVVMVGFSGIFQAFQWPAYQAAMQVLVPKEQFSRASGLIQLAEALANIGAPVLAGFFVVAGGIGLIFLIDVVTFLFAVATLLVVRFPRPAESAAGAEAAGTLWDETKYGFVYLWRRHGLFALMILFAMVNLVFGFIGPLFIPLGLSLTGAAALGAAFAVASTGMVAGSLVASAWKGFDRRILGILSTGVVLGFAMVLVAGRASIIWVTGAVWLGMSVVPVMSATSQALWLAKVEPDLQGRVASVRMTVGQSMIPISYVLVGPLADNVFEPLMADDGALAGTIGDVIGTGPGRGYALFFAVLGLIVIAMCFFAWLYPPLRNVEHDIPDVVVDSEEDHPEVPIVTPLDPLLTIEFEETAAVAAVTEDGIDEPSL